MKINIENRARLAFAIVIVLGAVSGYAWYLLASSQSITYQIRTQDSVSGLIVDAPVEFHGVEVGKVKRIELADPHSASILLSIGKEVPVTSATIATITARGLATRGFTGYVYISLEDSGADASPLVVPPGSSFPLIRIAPSRSLNMDSAITQVNENVQSITQLLQTLLDRKTIASFRQAVDNLQRVTAMLEENNRKLSSIIVNTEQASNQFQPLLASGNDTVKTLQLQILPEAYKTLADLNKLSGTLNGVAAKIDRNPSLLIRGSTPPAPGPGEAK